MSSEGVSDCGNERMDWIYFYKVNNEYFPVRNRNIL
jgi:hypothetical protein